MVGLLFSATVIAFCLIVISVVISMITVLAMRLVQYAGVFP